MISGVFFLICNAQHLLLQTLFCSQHLLSQTLFCSLIFAYRKRLAQLYCYGMALVALGFETGMLALKSILHVISSYSQFKKQLAHSSTIKLQTYIS